MAVDNEDALEEEEEEDSQNLKELFAVTFQKKKF
jgi:hypothetical protein